MTTLRLAYIFQNEEAAFKFAYDGNLLYDGGECKNSPQCRGHYVLGKKNSTQSGIILRCPLCHNTTSIFITQFFYVQSYQSQLHCTLYIVGQFK